jgi:hypothetical protein
MPVQVFEIKNDVCDSNYVEIFVYIYMVTGIEEAMMLTNNFVINKCALPTCCSLKSV